MSQPKARRTLVRKILWGARDQVRRYLDWDRSLDRRPTSLLIGVCAIVIMATLGSPPALLAGIAAANLGYQMLKAK